MSYHGPGYEKRRRVPAHDVKVAETPHLAANVQADYQVDEEESNRHDDEKVHCLWPP